MSFAKTVSALTYSIIHERCARAGRGTVFPHNRVVSFVLQQHGGMPDYLRLPLAALTVAFDLWAVPFTGRRFHRLPHEHRWRQVRAWKGSALGFRRDLVQFYESLVIFGCYAELYDSVDG
jgi:hypothetical protein